jgi:hypothetical protein
MFDCRIVFQEKKHMGVLQISVGKILFEAWLGIAKQEMHGLVLTQGLINVLFW